MKDFFISYNKADRTWAEWIAWTLEEAGYSVVFQGWDFRPGQNFVLKMQEAAVGTEATIAVLSSDYLNAEFTQPEWADAFKRDPQGTRRTLVPVRVKDCSPPGLLSPTIYIDLVNRSEFDARKGLLEGVGQDRAKPDKPPPFPGTDPAPYVERIMPNPVPYPGHSLPSEGSAKSDIPSNLPAGIPFFTGREDVLRSLEQALKAETALAQRQAISGLGGIGKTQTAIEYARRHHEEYSAILWAVAESRESLISDFAAIAEVLELPEVNAQDQTFVVQAVKRWFEDRDGWLLILDNADDPAIADEFLPQNRGGHVLVTSREQVFDVLGILNPVELPEMAPDDAKDFLLRRTGRRELEEDENRAAQKLARELDYLPLALEQAGAYIKELRSSFSDYLASYQKRGLELLERGHPSSKYRKSVRTTWSLNFQQVEKASTAAADLLRLSAFVGPDRIPIELITLGAEELGPNLSLALINTKVDPLALDEVIKPLIQYSLIHRDRKSKTYDIHRLVQAVLQDGMVESVKREWATRLVKSMYLVFPNVDQVSHLEWDRIERLLPHAQVCAELIKHWTLELEEAGALLNLIGRYLNHRGRLSETAVYYREALAIRERILGPTHTDFSTSLNNQAWLYFDQGKYFEAEPLFLKALSIREKNLGQDHPLVGQTLSLLGSLYNRQGRFVESNQTLLRSLEIREKTVGVEHSDTADSLSRLGALNISRRKFRAAKPMIERALNIEKKIHGPDYHGLSPILNDLGAICFHYGEYGEAKVLYSRSIALDEKTFGPNYPPIATSLGNLARLYIGQNDLDNVEQLLKRALSIREASLSANHPSMAHSLVAFGDLYLRQGKYAEAEPCYLRALEIREKSLGLEHHDVAHALQGLARLYFAQHKYSKGEPLIRRTVSILRRAFGFESWDTANAMILHAKFLKGLNRKGEAQKLESQARKIEHRLSKRQPD